MSTAITPWKTCDALEINWTGSMNFPDEYRYLSVDTIRNEGFQSPSHSQRGRDLSCSADAAITNTRLRWVHKHRLWHSKQREATQTKQQRLHTLDDEFVDTGVNKKISPTYVSANNALKIYVTLRSFPNGTWNCYNLSPSGGAKGKRYLIRAAFMYGNYDGKNETPQFDLHVNRWTTVELSNASHAIFYYEIVHVSRTTNVSVCLVNS
ncbi:putative LRR receptor-like serine/threonine-protein kinase [Acorus calamus]|uniref:LRR receptor-like serine/threonine-protein kinase n=1 Tax=Acorus calamus TaxID=4465 RepID=A0AAV9CP04_ACOCL|nr:putative LRR receptor-like serine/threonine-protein kinase [Acorus calamus]